MARFEKLKTPGMWKRGEQYYTRRRVGDKVRWVPLGSSFAQAIKRKGEIAGGAPIIKRITVERALGEWLALYIATRRNARGQFLAAQRARDFLIPLFGSVVLDKLSGDHIRIYRLSLEKRGFKPTTVWQVMSDLRTFLNWCSETERINRTPFRRGMMPKLKEQAPKGFTDEEITTLTSLPEPRGFEMRLLLGTGLRYGEACRAQASDIHEGALVLENTKSGRVRRIPIGAELLTECRQRIGRLFPYSEKCSGTYNETIRRITGIKGFHAHRCRHHFAMNWVAQGGSLLVLQELLGHASVVLTQRYARLTQDVVEREVRRVNEQG